MYVHICKFYCYSARALPVNEHEIKQKRKVYHTIIKQHLNAMIELLRYDPLLFIY